MRRGSAAVFIGAVVALLVPGSSALASCAEMSGDELWQMADIVFVGQALDGPVSGGTLLSPARFEVIEYLKGDGPDVVEVPTAVSEAGEGLYQHVSVGITPSPGEVWRIYAEHVADEPLATSVCSGSEHLYDQPLAEPGSGDGPTSGTVPMAGLALLGTLGAGVMGAIGVNRRRVRTRSTRPDA